MHNIAKCTYILLAIIVSQLHQYHIIEQGHVVVGIYGYEIITCKLRYTSVAYRDSFLNCGMTHDQLYICSRCFVFSWFLSTAVRPAAYIIHDIYNVLTAHTNRTSICVIRTTNIQTIIRPRLIIFTSVCWNLQRRLTVSR